MIELQVKPYCHGCKDFEPVKESVLMVYNEFYADARIIVKCEYADRCERIEKYLEKGE